MPPVVPPKPRVESPRGSGASSALVESPRGEPHSPPPPAQQPAVAAPLSQQPSSPRGSGASSPRSFLSRASGKEQPAAGGASPRSAKDGSALSRSSGGIGGLLRGSGKGKEDAKAVAVPSGSSSGAGAASAAAPAASAGKKKDSKGVFAGLLQRSRFGEPKKRGAGASAGGDKDAGVSLAGAAVDVVKTSELSGFNIPLSQMRPAAHPHSPAAAPLSQDDHVFVSPSQPGKRLRRRDEGESETGQCENCRGEALAWSELCECFLCERLVCQRCSRSNLCNVCAPRGAWSGGGGAAFRRALQGAEKSLLALALADAQAQASQAIAVNPQDPAPYIVRAECSRQAGDLGSALSDLTVAVELGGGSLAALSQRMMLYWNEGEADMAREDAAAILAQPASLRGTLPRLQAMLVKVCDFAREQECCCADLERLFSRRASRRVCGAATRRWPRRPRASGWSCWCCAPGAACARRSGVWRPTTRTQCSPSAPPTMRCCRRGARR